MGDGQTAQPDRRLKTTPVSGPVRGPTLQASFDKLRSIYVYTNELKGAAQNARQGKGGTVAFVTTSNRKLVAIMGRTYFPAGTFEAVLDQREADQRPTISHLKAIFPPDLDPNVVKALQAILDSSTNVLTWAPPEDNPGVMDEILRVFDASGGSTLRIVVSYSKAQSGNPPRLQDQEPLTDANADVLSDPEIARLYLEFMQHFGQVPVDYSLAEDGLTREELDTIEQGKQPRIDITNLFTQCVAEFRAAAPQAPEPAPELQNLSAMAEQIFFQRRVKNDLARRNQLAIGIGHWLFVGEDGKPATRVDIGVRRRSDNDQTAELLYDRNGTPQHFLGYADTEYRSTDLTKAERDTGIPRFEINVPNKDLYQFLRNLERELAHPVRETEALVVGLYKYSIYLSWAIAAECGEELAERVIAMLPTVLLFFVVHSIAAHLAMTGNPAAVGFFALMQGVGAVMGFDGALLSMRELAEAGRHFAMMEQIQRETSDGVKAELTELSRRHFRAGARLLTGVIVDTFAAGIIVRGVVKAQARVGAAWKKGANKPGARFEVEMDADGETVKEIKPTLIERVVKVLKEKLTKPSGIETKKGRKNQSQVPDDQNVGVPNAHVGEGQKSATPPVPKFKKERVPALDMTADEFEASPKAQRSLYIAANGALKRQMSLMKGVIKRLGIKKVTPYNELKRLDVDAFVKGIVAKVRERKGYATIREMTDIIRGRINVDNPKDVKRVVAEIQKTGLIGPNGVEPPKKRAGVAEGYPRWHVDVMDPETGIIHEWQIGTKQTTKLFQDPGIDVGPLRIEQKNTNIHDIEYDIFKSIDQPDAKSLSPETVAEYRALAQEVGISDYRRRVAEVSARTGRETIPSAELDALIKQLHAEAGALLKVLIQRRGVEWVQAFLPH